MGIIYFLFLNDCFYMVMDVLYRSFTSRYIMDAERKKKRKRHALFWSVTSCAIGAIATYYYKYIFKKPCMTSRQKGENWVQEILNGHPVRCLNAFRMEQNLFNQLCEDLQSKYGLEASKRMSVQQKVAIFLYIPARVPLIGMLESGFNILARLSVEHFMKFWKPLVVGARDIWDLHVML